MGIERDYSLLLTAHDKFHQAKLLCLETFVYKVSLSCGQWACFPLIVILPYGADHWNLVFVTSVCFTGLLTACLLGFYELPFVVNRLWIPVVGDQPGVLWHPDSEGFLWSLPASILSLFSVRLLKASFERSPITTTSRSSHTRASAGYSHWSRRIALESIGAI